MKKTNLIRAFIPGGLLSHKDLRKILGIASSLGNEVIHFGSRQDIMFSGNKFDEKKLEEAFGSIRTYYQWSLYNSTNPGEERRHQNIVTSLVVVDIVPATSWVTTGVYYQILEYFDYRPGMKVNITDPAQSLVPLFSGQLNFVASAHEHYWYLFLKTGNNRSLQRWPVLIYSIDIGKVSRAIEKWYYEREDEPSSFSVDALFEQVNKNTRTNNRTIDKELTLSTEPFPYYEGLNKMASNKYWLGLYWRNNRYTISFLEQVCDLCSATESGKIIITPWKSFIVKDISEKDRRKWDVLCGRNGINLRHSSLELNWHLPVLDSDALELKNYLVRILDEYDISTYGLTFSINTDYEDAFTSVVIQKQEMSSMKSEQAERVRDNLYTVFHSKKFNPNEEEYVMFARDVPRSGLPGVLIRLSRIYYEKSDTIREEKPPDKFEEKILTHPGIQCTRCLTIYDARYGDPSEGIPPRTPVSELPDEYSCPLCDSPKSDFKPVEISETAEVK